MDDELEKELQEAEASWPKTKALAFVMDDPLDKLMEKAQQIFKGKYWENLDALALRIADACPDGVTEKNFAKSEAVAGACKKYFANIEKLRTGLNRPFLDAKKAVDEAAKATVARAEPTLNPIIKAVKAIQDRKKREEEAKAEAARKKIEDDRLAAEKAHRDKIEAEHAAEKKRLADEAAASRKQADDLVIANRRAGEELKELRRQMAEFSKPAKVNAVVDFLEAPVFESAKQAADIVKSIEKSSPPTAKMCQVDEHGYPILPPPTPSNAAYVEAENLLPIDTDAKQVAPYRPGPVTGEWVTKPVLMSQVQDPNSFEPSVPFYSPDKLVHEDDVADRFRIHAFGDAIAAIKRPECVNEKAKVEVELAAFDLNEISKRLQEWRMS